MKTYEWGNVLIAANSESEAMTFLQEDYAPSEIRRHKMRLRRRKVDLIEGGHSITIKPSEIGDYFKPGIIPDAS